MKLIRSIIALVAAMASMVVSAGDSAPFLLDTVTTSTSPVVDSLSISWDASWIGGDAGATVVIADNGVEVKRTTGAGEFTHVLSVTGRHDLTYTTYIGSVVQEKVYTATVIGCHGNGFSPVGGTMWHVNGSTGSDSNSGMSESAAKATIQAAIDASAEGDTILVAPGTYAPIVTANKAITIKSTAGTSDTVIDGGGASQRCVTACADEHDKGIYTNTVLIGFTLQNGDGQDAWGGCANGGIYKGCVLLNGTGGNAGNAILENCLVKGGRGINGGNLIGCVARNCTIVDGYAEDNGGAYYNCAVFNSICYNNDSGWRLGDDGGTGYQVGSWDWGALVSAFGGQLVNVYKGDPNFMDATNGDYRLAAGSPCIDAGDNLYVTGDKDLAGNARIANGTVDIRCYEYGSVPVTGKWTVTQYNLNARPLSVSDAEAYLTDSSKWDGSPVTRTYQTISFEDSDIGVDRTNFDVVPFPGNFDFKHDCYVVEATGRIRVTEAGYWTFACGADNGFKVTISGNGLDKTFTGGNYYGYGTGVCAVNFPSAGEYEVRLLHFEDSGRAVLDFSVAKGNYSNFDSSVFKLVGDPASGVTLAGGTEYHTVSFDLNGADGAAPAGRSVAHGAAVGELPHVTRAGYSFDGWFTAASGGTKVTAATEVTGDVTYYAQWTASMVNCTVMFNANGGAGTMAAQTFQAGVAQPLMVNAFTYTGHTFAGWATNASGNVVYADGSSITPTSDLALYAVWTEIPSRVSFFIDGGVLTAVDLNGETEVVIPSGVTSIGNYAFYDCNELTQVFVPEGVTNIGDYAFYDCSSLKEVSLPDSLVACRCDEVFYDTPFLRSKKFPDFILSRSGKKLFGVKRYDAEEDFSVGLRVVIPATVVQICDHALGCFWVNHEGRDYLNSHGKCIEFAGAKPKASELAFARVNWVWDEAADEYVEVYSIDWSGVYYHEEATGWSWGEDWCGVRTYALNEVPAAYAAESNLKFGRVYGGALWSESGWSAHEIWDNNDVGLYGDNYALIPVTGKGTIKPVIYGDVPSGYLDTPEIWTEQQMFNTFTPKGVSSSKWDCEDEYKWCYETSGAEWEWPREIWPQKTVETDRRWIVIHAKEKNVWSGVWSFRVGLAGTSEISDPIIVVPIEDFDGNGLLSKHTPSDFMRGITFSGYENFEAWEGAEYSPMSDSSDPNPRMQTFEIENWKSVSSGKAMTFKAAVPSAGTLVVSGEEDDDDSLAMKNVFSVAGNGIVSDKETVKPDDLSSPDYRYSITNFWKTSNASHVRRIEVSKATTLTFTSDTNDNDCQFNRMYFFPKSGKSVAVDVGYIMDEYYDGAYAYWGHTYVQGYVTGGGVYKSGETATLKAISGPGEEFDYWEVRFGNLTLTEAQKTSPTLSFPVTDAMCGEMEDEEQIFISAIWKPKYKVTALPSTVGAGTVTGTGRYHEGTMVTLTATAADGCTFVRWSDGETSPTRRVEVVAADVERVLYACFEAPNGVPNPDAYRVTFAGNGGEVSEAIRMVEKGQAVGTLPTDPIREKYKFLGWYTAVEGGTQVTATTKVTGDVTYYAHWRYVGDADDSTIVFNMEETYETEADGSLSLNLSELVGSTSTPKLTVKGLPTGLKFDAKTGTVSGKATKPGVYKVTVSATNATVKKAVTAEFTITVPNFTTPMFEAAGLDTTGKYELMSGVVPAVAGRPPYRGINEVVATVVEGGWKLAVSGLPAGLKYDAKNNNITGVASKEGFYTVYFTATRGSGKSAEKEIATATFEVVFPTLTLEMAAWDVASATNKCKVAGSGRYPFGKKVTLKVTPAKGSVFVGWQDGGRGATALPGDGAAVSSKPPYLSQAASYAYVTTDEDVTLTAVFATEAEDVSSLQVEVEDVTTAADGTVGTLGEDGNYALDLSTCVTSLSQPKLAVSGLPTGVKYDAKTMKITGKATKPGVYTVTVKATNTSVKKATDASTVTFKLTVPNFECAALPKLRPATGAYGIVQSGVLFDPDRIDCTPANGWTVKVAGLPTGLKYDAKSGKITGVSTAKPGSYTVTFTASKKGEANQVATITLNVEALPDWVVGTFYGKNVGRGRDGSWTCPQQFAVTVSANGKVSMKTSAPGEGSESRTTQLTECRGDGNYAFSFHYTSGRKGKEGYTDGDCGGVISPATYGADGTLLGCLTTHDAGVCDEDDDPYESEGVVYQSLYSRKPAVAGLPVFGKDNTRAISVASDITAGAVTLKFGSKGAVTATWSGTKPTATCSSYITPYARDADGTVHAKLWLTFLDKTHFGYYDDPLQVGLEFDLAIPAASAAAASDMVVKSVRVVSWLADFYHGGPLEIQGD